jgi:hypothetical protein
MTAISLLDKLASVQRTWEALWPEALERWSKFTKLSEPRWCLTEDDEKRQGLTGSFAMIRLTDQAVVIGLRRVVEQGVQDFGAAIMAHEIGHHVYCPANLLDHGRMLARIRRGLPTKEHLAPFVANLYADLLINDRLQRQADVNIAAVYRQLGGGSTDRAWVFYMRIYEILWSLTRGTLALGAIDGPMEGDAQLGARLIRSYSQDWLDGAGRFAVLILPYLLDQDGRTCRGLLRGWLDTEGSADVPSGVPAGLAEIDDGEIEGAIHPSQDPRLTGLHGEDGDKELGEGTESPSGRRALRGGKRVYRDFRGPIEYREILKALGSTLSDHEITMHYYRERAVPHLIRFPVRESPESTEPMPEGLEPWEVTMPLEEVDWLQTAITSPTVIPGLTTVQRTYCQAPGSLPDKEPIDLYLGVDCSGSMINPQMAVSYPVLAGTIIALSALRAGSRVMAVLSGESPGEAVSTGGFVSDEQSVLKVLTGYLGTGYSFGIHRLQDTFASRKPGDRPVHILIVSDHDLFSMLDQPYQRRLGWDIARDAVAKARSGGTYALNMPPSWEPIKVARMQADGWRVHSVEDWQALVQFARAFSQAHYAEKEDRGNRRPAS